MSRKPSTTSGSEARSLPFWGTYALALAVLGGTIFLSAHSLRAKCREQITIQHAHIVSDLWLVQKKKFDESELAPGSSERASDQLPAVLETARLPEFSNFFF